MRPPYFISKKNYVGYIVPAGLLLLCLFLKSDDEFNSPRGLWWLLKPLSLMVNCLSGTRFSFNSSNGFIDASGTILLGPSCSGFNFMIITLLLSVFHFFPLLSVKRQLLFVTPFIILSWAFALMVNASRIATSILFLHHSNSFHALGTDKMHEALGIAYYLFFLLIYFFIARHFLNKKTTDEQPA